MLAMLLMVLCVSITCTAIEDRETCKRNGLEDAQLQRPQHAIDFRSYSEKETYIDRNNSYLANQTNVRLVNGEDVIIDFYPFMVSVHQSNKYICSGTILHKKGILTAASCVWKWSRSNLMVQVFNNKSNYNNYDAYRVEKVITHKKYDPNTRSFNIAILEIEPIWNLLDRQSQLRGIPTGIAEETIPVYYVAFGSNKPGGHPSIYLQHIQGFLVPKEICRQEINYLDQSMMCIEPRKQFSGMCTGDEGGAVLIYQKNLNKIVQVGVLSEPHICMSNTAQYDVFINLFHREIRDFIVKYAAVKVLPFDFGTEDVK